MVYIFDIIDVNNFPYKLDQKLWSLTLEKTNVHYIMWLREQHIAIFVRVGNVVL